MPNYRAHTIDELFTAVTERQLSDQDEMKEVKYVERVSETDDLENEPTPDIEHLRCFVPGCGRPRSVSTKGKTAGKLSNTCAICGKDAKSRARASSERRHFEGGAPVVAVKPKAKAAQIAPPAEPTEKHRAAVATLDQKAPHVCSCSGRSDAMLLERALLNKLLEEIGAASDEKTKRDCVLALSLVERIVG